MAHVPRFETPVSSALKVFVSRQEVKFQGIFDYTRTITEMHKWFTQHGFHVEETIHKVKPPELEIALLARRWDTGYRMTILSVYFHAWSFKEVKLKVKGKERKMASALVSVKMGCDMYFDYEGRFSKNKFSQFARDFVHKFIMFYQFTMLDFDKVYYELVDFNKHTRQWLGMTLPGGIRYAYP